MQTLVRDTPPTLTVDLHAGKLIYGRLELDMHPARLALYAFFAGQKRDCRLSASCSDCTACFLEAGMIDGEAIARFYARIHGTRLLAEMSNSGIGSLTRENFQSYKSKIRRDIAHTFGATQAPLLEIASIGTRPDTRYGIRLSKERIEIKD